MPDPETASESASSESVNEPIEELRYSELVPPFNDDLWLDRLVRPLGFGWLSDRLPGDIPPSYIYAVIMVVTLPTIIGGHGIIEKGDQAFYIQNPLAVLQPLGIMAAVFGARSLRAKYHRVLHEMNIEERTANPTHFTNIIPKWLPWIFVGLLVTANYTQVALRGGPLGIYRESGLSAMLGWTVANPIWTTMTVQFAVVYIGIVFVAPWRLWKSDVGIDFYDPEGLGGLRPIGELVKHAYYYAVVGLIAYALVLYGPIVSAPGWEVATGTSLIFTVVWLGAVATVAFAVFVLHRFMHREKREELHRLRMLEQKRIDTPWDGNSYSPQESDDDVVDDLRQQMDRVSSTNEYPATFSIWSQLLLSIILPKASQLLIAGL